MTRKHATVCFPPVLNTDHPVFNLIDYLCKTIPKVVLQKKLEMFWKILQVTFEIFCSHVAQVGTGVFLEQTHQIAGYISTELIEQKDHL